MATKRTHRGLTRAERDGLLELLQAIDRLDHIFRALRSAGVETGLDFEAFENGQEVIRALATDTHSLVRETDV